MQPVAKANTYHAVIRSQERLAAGKTNLKVYFIDIVGRKDPSRTEWDKCGIDRRQFLDRLAKTEGVEGVGFVTAFPHITKAFRFGPENENVLNVRAWSTRDMAPLDLARSDRYVEFACLAEAVLAKDEYDFWAKAETVEAYLAQWSGYSGGAVERNDKLLAYWGAK